MVEAEGGDPAQQLVGQSADDDPRRVGQELSRWGVVPAGAFFEVADSQLDHCVVAVIGVEEHGGAGPVGDKSVMAPLGPPPSLVADRAGAAHDEPVAFVDGLGHLGRTAVGVVDDVSGTLVDRGDGVFDHPDLLDSHGEGDVVAPAGGHDLSGMEPRVGPPK